MTWFCHYIHNQGEMCTTVLVIYIWQWWELVWISFYVGYTHSRLIITIIVISHYIHYQYCDLIVDHVFPYNDTCFWIHVGFTKFSYCILASCIHVIYLRRAYFVSSGMVSVYHCFNLCFNSIKQINQLFEMCLVGHLVYYALL